MSSEWEAVGLTADPTPGDPEAVRSLATRLGLHATTADGATTRLRTIASGGGGDLAMRGDYAAGYEDALRDLPDQLAKLAKAYRGAGAALATYATTLGDAKTRSGTALRDGLDAQIRYRGAVAQVESLLPPDRVALLWPNDELSPQSITAATADLAGAGSAGHIEVIARRGREARFDQTLAARLAQDAKTLRDGAASSCAHGIDEALRDSGIKNRPWWKKSWDFAKAPFTSWDRFVSFCAGVALVAGVLAAVVFTGGAAAAILGAVAFGAGLVVLGDSVAKWRQGRGSFGMVLLNAASLVPGGKALGPGLRGLRGASAAVRVGGRGSRLVTGTLRVGGTLGRAGRRVTAALPFGIGRAGAARGSLLTGADRFARSAWCRVLGRDPIDLASGQMILTQTDVELPGVLDWALRRTYQSAYTCGRWFGPGWSSTLDLRLEVDERGVCYTAPDGVLLAFEHPERGGPAVLPEQGPRTELVLDETGCYSIVDAAAGQILRFATPAVGQRGVVLPLLAVADRNGNTVELGYDLAGDLAQVVHSGGYQLDVETRDHLVVAVRVATGEAETGRELVRYGYDDAGRLTHVYNSSGRPLRFDYDDAGRIVRWTDRNGTSYHYAYDAAGRVVRTEGSGGFLNGTIDYDETSRITRETNSLGDVTEHHFTERMRPLRSVDPLGRRTTFTWDPFDNRTAETDPLGRTVRYRYDAAGNLTAVERPDGTVTTTSWNEQRRPVTTVDADGARVEREYDTRGNLVAVVDPLGARTRFRYDDRGRLMAVTDALGQVTQVETDAAGLPATVVDPLGAAVSYDRDALGRVVAAIDPIGGVTRFSWTPEGRLAARTLPDGATDTFRYDGEGNLVEEVDAAGLVTTTETTHFDLPAARTGPDGARLAFGYDTELRQTTVTNPQGLVWRYDHDAAGQLVGETDFNGRVLRYEYDAAGQLAARTNGAAETVTFTRDALGNVVEKRGPNGVTTFRYDAAGRVVHARGPDAEVTVERDLAGRVTAETVNGRRVTSTYDAAGRRIRRATPSGAVSGWEFDAAGRPLALHTAGHTLRFTHDAAGREIERLLTPGAHGGPRTNVALTQTWDANHQLRSQTVTAGPSAALGTISASLGRPAGAAVTRLLRRRDFAYSPDGYLTEIDDLADGLRRFDLDPMRRVVAVTGSGWQERYAYDTAGNVTDATWPTLAPAAPPGQGSGSLGRGAGALGQGAGAPEQGTSRGHGDERGPRAYAGTLIRHAGAVRYEHDAQGRVTRRQRARLSGRPRTWRYAWDADDRLTGVTTPEGTMWHYRYDPFGRRVAKERLTADGSVAERTDFVWDGTVLAEQHHTVITVADADVADGVSVTTWDWEPDSFRPLAQTERRPVARASGPRGIRAVDDPATSAPSPDSDGARGSARQAGAAGKSGSAGQAGSADPDDSAGQAGSAGPADVADPADFAGQSGSGGSDHPDQAWFDARFHAIVTDLVGAPTELLSPDGTIAWRARTTLWGVTAPPTPDTPTCPLRFPGQYHDPESTLNYNYHRHYDPTTARYESPDPLGLAPAANPSAYVLNPLSWSDPVGLMACPRLTEHYRQLEKYADAGFKELESGRIRYYGNLSPPIKPGEMIGRRTVREWDPATDMKRTWHETVDSQGRVRQVRLIDPGPNLHYLFDADGRFVKRW